jgi:hypothetical protein
MAKHGRVIRLKCLGGWGFLEKQIHKYGGLANLEIEPTTSTMATAISCFSVVVGDERAKAMPGRSLPTPSNTLTDATG